MDREEKLACLRLIRTPNIGPMTFSLLLQRYGSAIEALRAVPELAKRGGRSLKPAGRALAEAELQANEDAGASLLFKGAGDYPARLAQFDDAPPVLSVRGSPHLLSRPSVGIVGARNASINAQRLAQSLAEDLAAEGYVIVSGLARGIDAAAHNGALAGGTVAVIACGIDIIYPPENADLHESIAQTGLLVAEMLPGTQPTPRHFPIRNRIIGALALGVVVVEAAERSGSLITAREAGERGGEARSGQAGGDRPVPKRHSRGTWPGGHRYRRGDPLVRHAGLNGAGRYPRAGNRRPADPPPRQPYLPCRYPLNRPSPKGEALTNSGEHTICGFQPQQDGHETRNRRITRKSQDHQPLPW